MTDSEDKRRNYMAPLGIDIRRLAKPVLGKKGFSDIDIIVNWEDIIGTKTAQYVHPLKLAFPKGKRDNAVLHVAVAGGAFAAELSHNKLTVLAKINTFFGYQAVSDIKIKQEAFTPAQDTASEKSSATAPELSDGLKSLLAGIDDEEMQESLARLGKAVIASSSD
ncbi:MAG: DUF721 domain-containing protein [Alphaproteobacteria bacterium]|nr:DUF721 domain-containing protein [Alphaproteobacteria bacterium]